MLKDTDTIVDYHLKNDDTAAPKTVRQSAVSIPATLDALKKVLDDAVHG